MEPKLLLSRLSFSHFLELLPLDEPLQRSFYEVNLPSEAELQALVREEQARLQP